MECFCGSRPDFYQQVAGACSCLTALGQPPRLLRAGVATLHNTDEDPWAQSDGQTRDHKRFDPQENQYPAHAAQEDAPMEPARGQVGRKQAPSTPRDAQITDADEARHPPNARRIILYYRLEKVGACGGMADLGVWCPRYLPQEHHILHQASKLHHQAMATHP